MQFKYADKGKAESAIGRKDIRSVFTLLAIQCMIQTGEIPDPVSGKKLLNLDNARLYYGLLEVMRDKTKGNLNKEEHNLLSDFLDNLGKVMAKKAK